MLIDADDFKLINDKYGHLEGDKALVKITNILKKAISNTGKDHFLARYGGDEFIIVGKVNSKTDIEELIRYIEDEENKYNENNESKYKISLSIGYSLRNDTHTSVEEVRKKFAEEDMYCEINENENGCISIEIEWGDWKHTHGYSDYLMEKIILKGENSNLRYGVCEMQGWRKHMVNIFLINRKMLL